jgi:hypothetical protein
VTAFIRTKVYSNCRNLLLLCVALECICFFSSTLESIDKRDDIDARRKMHSDVGVEIASTALATVRTALKLGGNFLTLLCG